MSLLRNVKGHLSELSVMLSRRQTMRGTCRQCHQQTLWVVHLGSGYFRCTGCGKNPNQNI